MGHYADQPGVPMDDAQFQRPILSRVTPVRLALFYARHPHVLVDVLLCDLRDWPYVNLDLNGEVYGHRREVDIRSGKRPFELTAWSGLRRKFFGVAPFYRVYLLVLSVVLSGVCLLNPRAGARFPMWTVILLVLEDRWFVTAS